MLRSSPLRDGALRLGAVLILAAALAACSGQTTVQPTSPASAAPVTAVPATSAASAQPGTPSGPAPSVPVGTMPVDSVPPAATTPPAASLPPSATDTPIPTDAGPTASPEPDPTGGTTTGGDIPDNAVFLTYADVTHAFSIQYVEGWQVSPTGDGVAIRDKDSSETVQIVAPVNDVAAYVSGTDLPALQQTDGFKLLTQDSVKIHGAQIVHLQYEQLSPPDPVTNKRIPSLVDRYYLSGSAGLASVTLSTPRKVDNVDAFKQMVESFAWK